MPDPTTTASRAPQARQPTESLTAVDFTKADALFLAGSTAVIIGGSLAFLGSIAVIVQIFS